MNPQGGLTPRDFESRASAIPPLRHKKPKKIIELRVNYTTRCTRGQGGIMFNVFQES